MVQRALSTVYAIYSSPTASRMSARQTVVLSSLLQPPVSSWRSGEYITDCPQLPSHTPTAEQRSGWRQSSGSSPTTLAHMVSWTQTPCNVPYSNTATHQTRTRSCPRPSVCSAGQLRISSQSCPVVTCLTHLERYPSFQGGGSQEQTHEGSREVVWEHQEAPTFGSWQPRTDPEPIRPQPHQMG